MVLESAWLPPNTAPKFSLADWMEDWGRGRCGFDSADVAAGACVVES